MLQSFVVLWQKSAVQLFNCRFYAGKGGFAAHHAGKVGAAAGGALLARKGNAQRVQQPAVLLAQLLSLGLAGIEDGIAIAKIQCFVAEHRQQGFQCLLGGFRGGLLLLVGVHAHIVLGHRIKEIQLFRDLAQHFAAGLQVCAQQLLVDGAVYGLVDPRLRLLLELFRGQAADIFCVDGPQLEGIEDGRRLGDAVRRPDLDQFRQGEDLLLGILALGAPAQQADVVQHGLGQVALCHQILITGIAVALGKLILRILHDRRAVDVGGDLPAERLIQQVVLGGRGQILAAADHVGDAHEVIVHHICKVVGGHAVGLDEDLVVHLAVVHLDVAVHHIVEAGHALAGDLLADNIGFPGSKTLFHFVLGQVAAASVIVGHLTVGALLSMQGLQTLLGAEAIVCLALCHQLLGILFEHAHALALHIGAHWAADVRAFVPQQAGLPQGVVDDIHSALHIAALIGILDAQDEGAVLVLCHQVGVQGSAQVANVHITRGRRRKTGADFIARHRKTLLYSHAKNLRIAMFYCTDSAQFCQCGITSYIHIQAFSFCSQYAILNSTTRNL